MNKIAKFIDNERGQPWTIRIIDKGDAYGRDDCLIHENDEPTIEFYDGDNLFDKDEASGEVLGQFVSRYYISTIADGSKGGIDLMGYEPKWKIEHLMLDSVRAYISTWAASMNYSWEEDGMFSTKFHRVPNAVLDIHVGAN